MKITAKNIIAIATLSASSIGLAWASSNPTLNFNADTTVSQVKLYFVGQDQVFQGNDVPSFMIKHGKQLTLGNNAIKTSVPNTIHLGPHTITPTYVIAVVDGDDKTIGSTCYVPIKQLESGSTTLSITSKSNIDNKPLLSCSW